MEWLLILSAMLSAVTGVFTGARADEAQIHRSEAAVVAEAAAGAVQVTAPQLAIRKVATRPSGDLTPLPVHVVVAVAPLEAVKLIE